MTTRLDIFVLLYTLVTGIIMHHGAATTELTNTRVKEVEFKSGQRYTLTHIIKLQRRIVQ